ncbi:hypothetical protein ACHAW5_000900 [Stephanodiscus triporus]|uniref:Uncharacterized protein n=1 Tax=Stephanodiscus triporus TaxID=2934178 RepID=A0ABD3P245_9STRA
MTRRDQPCGLFGSRSRSKGSGDDQTQLEMEKLSPTGPPQRTTTYGRRCDDPTIDRRPRPEKELILAMLCMVLFIIDVLFGLHGNQEVREELINQLFIEDMADHSRKSDELDTTRTFHSSKASLDVVDQVSTLIVLELVLAIDVHVVHVLFNLFLHAVIPEVFDGMSTPAG